MELRKAVSNRIVELLNERGMSNSALAAKAGVHTSTIDSIINPPMNPTLSSIEKICDGLGVTVREFFDDDSFGEES